MKKCVTAVVVAASVIVTLAASGGCALAPQGFVGVDAEGDARATVTVILDRVVKEGVGVGPGSVNVFWTACPKDAAKRSVTVRGTVAILSGRLRTSTEALSIADAISQTLVDERGIPVESLEVRIPGGHNITVPSPDSLSGGVRVRVPIMDALGHDDAVLLVDAWHSCVDDPPNRLDEDELVARAAAEQATTTMSGTAASTAVRTSCRDGARGHAWVSTVTMPVVGDLATAITVTLAKLPATSGWTLAARVNTSTRSWWSARDNPMVHVRMEGRPGSASAAVTASTGCWPQHAPR